MTTARPRRPAGWDVRLIDAVAAAADRSWAWGAHDCASFAGATAEAMLAGPCAWSGLLRRHATALGARRLIARQGAADLAALMDTCLPRIAPAAAQRGDVAMVTLDDEDLPDAEVGAQVLCVVEGVTLVAAAAPRGLIRLPRRSAFAAWPVDPIERV